MSEQRLRDLMVAYQGGAFGAFEDLYAALLGPVRGWLTNALRDRVRADDLAQEVFLQLHRARHTYDPAYPVLPWVMAIVRHVYLMDRRTAARRPRYTAEDDAPERAVVPDVERRAGGAVVRSALRQVHPDRRAALLMHHVGGWSFREIGRRLGIKEAAAKLRSSRGMAQLREALRARRDEP